MKRIGVAVFVDWQSQLINSRGIRNIIPKRAANQALSFVAKTVSSTLEKIDEKAIFFAEVKIYHGWHRGLTPMPSYKALKEVFIEGDAPGRVGRVSFDWQQPFGNILTNCSSHRMHQNLRVHLPNTLRADLIDSSKTREKMVDTALTCDVLASARSNPSDVRLILGEDDDLVPSAFTADSWGKERGGRTFIVRKRESSEFLNMSGIYRQMEGLDGTN